MPLHSDAIASPPPSDLGPGKPKGDTGLVVFIALILLGVVAVSVAFLRL